ncbi:ABC transporter substrate-binding protein [Cupriavidus sp. DF5525]|uniref:ABC transporter substrate-binding protein n=1 Tax=Cupriavidus sp. DF5525 TaxID=3160989 RepID=UPI0032DF16B9
MNCIKRIALTLVLACIAGISAAAERPIELIIFPGGSNWPLWVAQDKGFFSVEGVAVNVTPTPSSVFQMTNLIDGKFDIAMTAVDNLIAYREGQGEVSGKVGADLVAVMGGDRGFLKLVAAPGVESIAGLRGKTVSVDAKSSGYAAVLFELLARAGLGEADYKVERVGGVLQRFQALMEGKQSATLLVSPFELQAQARGFKVLESVSDRLGAYQGAVAGVRLGWAQQNQARLESFIRAYVKGVEWLYDPANKAEALRLFLERMPNSNPAMAEAAFKVLVNEKSGFQRRAALDPAGLEQVLKLRSKWGVPSKEMGSPSKYYDRSYYDRATGH